MSIFFSEKEIMDIMSKNKDGVLISAIAFHINKSIKEKIEKSPKVFGKAGYATGSVRVWNRNLSLNHNLKGFVVNIESLD